MPRVAKERKTSSRSDPLSKGDGNARKKTGAVSPGTKNTGKQQEAASIDKGEGTKKAKGGSARGMGKKTQTSSKSKEAGRAPRNPNQKHLLLLARLRTNDPTITRLLSVPSNLTFEQFHQVMQIAFGWANCHMYAFRVEKASSHVIGDDDDSEDESWPTPIMNIAREPQEKGPYQDKDANKMTIEDLYHAEEYKDGVELIYEYDMGDSWDHDIVFIGVENSSTRKMMRIPSELPIACLAGEGHPCAEDCGSFPGWEYLKEVFAQPRSKDPDGLREWYKKQCINGDPKGLNPYKWDIFRVNDELASYAKAMGI